MNQIETAIKTEIVSEYTANLESSIIKPIKINTEEGHE